MTFEIGQTVYHLASHEKGIVTDIRRYERIRFVQYNIVSSFGSSNWCDEMELTDEKPLDL